MLGSPEGGGVGKCGEELSLLKNRFSSLAHAWSADAVDPLLPLRWPEIRFMFFHTSRTLFTGVAPPSSSWSSPCHYRSYIWGLPFFLIPQGFELWGHPWFVVCKVPYLLGWNSLLYAEVSVVCDVVGEGIKVITVQPAQFLPVFKDVVFKVYFSDFWKHHLSLRLQWESEHPELTSQFVISPELTLSEFSNQKVTQLVYYWKVK